MADTSREAYRETRGSQAQSRRQVLQLLREHPEGLTGPEVDHLLNDGHRGHDHKRLSELEQDRKVHTRGERRKRFGGGVGSVARVYHYGAPGSATPTPNPDRTAKEIMASIQIAEANLGLLWKQYRELTGDVPEQSALPGVGS